MRHEASCHDKKHAVKRTALELELTHHQQCQHELEGNNDKVEEARWPSRLGDSLSPRFQLSLPA